MTSTSETSDPSPLERLALVPQPVLGPRMAGPGWRYWRLAGTLRELLPELEVVLLAPPGSSPPEPGEGPEIREVPPTRLRHHLGDFQAVLTQGAWFSPARDGAALTGVRLVLDFYDPLPVELPGHYRHLHSPREGQRRYQDFLRRFRALVRRADAFLVANQRQRDLLLGLCLAGGRFRLEDLAPERDPRERFLEVPCGTDPSPPTPSPGDRLGLAWGGGPWGWFDTDGALELARELHSRDPRFRLVLPGTEPPGPARKLAERSGMGARVEEDPTLAALVEWNPGWQPRRAFLETLAGCRVGLCLAPPGLESEFAHRTRVLDYLTAGLPVLFSGDDPLARRAEQEGWGRSLPGDDLPALVEAARSLALPGPERIRALEAVEEARSTRVWERAVAPLADYLLSPPRAHDPPGWVPELMRNQVARWT